MYAIPNSRDQQYQAPVGAVSKNAVLGGNVLQVIQLSTQHGRK